MKVLSKCKAVVFQGRCPECGSLIECSKEEYDNWESRLLEVDPEEGILEECPACGKQIETLLDTEKFYVNTRGIYCRGRNMWAL